MLEPEFYFIVFDDEYKILHATGFEKYPTIGDILDLLKTIRTDIKVEDLFFKKMDTITTEQFNKIKGKKWF